MKTLHILMRGTLALILSIAAGSYASAQVGYGSSTLPPEPAPPMNPNPPMDVYSAAAGPNTGGSVTGAQSNPFTGSALFERSAPGTRLFQNFGATATWITPQARDHNMGLFRIDAAGDVAFPFGGLEQPLFLEPRFALNLWNGPKSDEYDMAGNTFDASLALRWNPNWQLKFLQNPIRFDLLFSVGLYSEFSAVNGHSFRFPSWAYAAYDVTPTIQLKFGAWYLDRVRYKIFPAGGIIWTPNPQWEFQILFPSPRITYKPAGTSGKPMDNIQMYVRGDYGGGSWTVGHEYGGNVRTDYNDYRILFGVDWQNPPRAEGFLEVGVAFARELYFADDRKGYDLDPGFILQGGITF